jgi:hypothetical protein
MLSGNRSKRATPSVTVLLWLILAARCRQVHRLPLHFQSRREHMLREWIKLKMYALDRLEAISENDK